MSRKIMQTQIMPFVELSTFLETLLNSPRRIPLRFLVSIAIPCRLSPLSLFRGGKGGKDEVSLSLSLSLFKLHNP